MIANNQTLTIEHSRTPRFSLIVPVYNVAQYLPEFLDSLVAQTLSASEREIIFVNDGSTDESYDMLCRWMSSNPTNVILISQANRGLAAARNAGMEQAGAEWISFPDPDDVLDRDYLSRIREFIDAAPQRPDLVCGHVLLLDDATGVVSNSHPLRAKFEQGEQIVNMERCPEYIHLQAASGFYDRERVNRLSLRFRDDVRPNFEDAYFTALYLLDTAEPMLGIAAQAKYEYRRRSDGSSLVQQSWRREEKYTVLPRTGYLRLLHQARARRGAIPVWLQNTVLYDLLFYFRHDHSMHGMTAGLPPSWLEKFHAAMEQIFELIDTPTIESFAVCPTSQQLRTALIAGYQHTRRDPTDIPLVRIDRDRQIVQVRYFYGGHLPAERYQIDGCIVEPTFQKVRDIEYFGRVLLRERIVWLPAQGRIRIWLNDLPVPLTFGQPADRLYLASESALWRTLAHSRAPRRVPESAADRERRSASDVHPVTRVVRGLRRRAFVVSRTMRGRKGAAGGPLVPQGGPFADLDPAGDKRLRVLARSAAVRARYGDAWTLIDRDTEAHDNAEHLYRYLQSNHGEINAWFVLRRDSADWDRLAADGFRLVPYGTPEHVLLLLNTEHLISSQVDHYIAKPLDAARFGRKAWRFTFLQHGVTKDDLSRWINGKPISRLITASRDEHESIRGDHTPYIFTDKEVRLTGFPRHDRLLRLGREVSRPDLITIMPTWRRYLMDEATVGNERRLKVPLAHTTFGASWFELVGSEKLRALAANAGLTIVLVPHPNMQQYIQPGDLAPGVRLETYTGSDIQEILARSALVVTDYSSQAFEAGYLERAVVYYQFDKQEFFGGGHVYRQSRWSYDLDGFGPVVTTMDAALTAIEEAVTLGKPDQPYLGRMRNAFPYRDGRCCERTFNAIVDLKEPLTFQQACTPVTFRPVIADAAPMTDDFR